MSNTLQWKQRGANLGQPLGATAPSLNPYRHHR